MHKGRNEEVGQRQRNESDSTAGDLEEEAPAQRRQEEVAKNMVAWIDRCIENGLDSFNEIKSTTIDQQTGQVIILGENLKKNLIENKIRNLGFTID